MFTLRGRFLPMIFFSTVVFILSVQQSYGGDDSRKPMMIEIEQECNFDEGCTLYIRVVPKNVHKWTATLNIPKNSSTRRLTIPYDDVYEGEYTFLALSRNGYAIKQVQINPEVPDNLSVKLNIDKKYGVARGRISLPDGSAMTGAVSIRRRYGGRYDIISILHKFDQMAPLQNGEFSTPLLPGKYSMIIGPDRKRGYAIKEFEIESNEVYDLDTQLSEDSLIELRGRIVDPEFHPLKGVQVGYHFEDGCFGNVKTDKNGVWDTGIKVAWNCNKNTAGRVYLPDMKFHLDGYRAIDPFMYNSKSEIDNDIVMYPATELELVVINEADGTTLAAPEKYVFIRMQYGNNYDINIPPETIVNESGKRYIEGYRGIVIRPSISGRKGYDVTGLSWYIDGREDPEFAGKLPMSKSEQQLVITVRPHVDYSKKEYYLLVKDFKNGSPVDEQRLSWRLERVGRFFWAKNEGDGFWKITLDMTPEIMAEKEDGVTSCMEVEFDDFHLFETTQGRIKGVGDGSKLIFPINLEAPREEPIVIRGTPVVYSSHSLTIYDGAGLPIGDHCSLMLDGIEWKSETPEELEKKSSSYKHPIKFCQTDKEPTVQRAKLLLNGEPVTSALDVASRGNSHHAIQSFVDEKGQAGVEIDFSKCVANNGHRIFSINAKVCLIDYLWMPETGSNGELK